MKRIKFWKEAWSAIPVVIFTLAGIAVSILTPGDSQEPALLGGLFLIVLGVCLELIVRSTLIGKANFPDIFATKRLLIVDEHKLITDGVFGYIRHPLYLGRIMAHFGIALCFFSFWGAVVMAISALSFLNRIRIEEEMLTNEFGAAYHEYRQHTKKLIPFIY